MELWQKILAGSVREPRDLLKFFPNLNTQSLEAVTAVYPMCINPYYLNLIQETGDAIWRQSIPDPLELEPGLLADPLAEEEQSPVPCLIHRYPDRVLFEVTTACAMYCRFCTRKRKVGKSARPVCGKMRKKAVEYIAGRPEVRDVILSGGDPLLLTDKVLESLLEDIRGIPHVEIIRIGTRVPCVLPHRITEKLVGVIKKFHPIYLNTHFEHPRELTAEACQALGRLADAGIPLGNQSVLLAGVNDSPEIIKELNRKLLAARVRPYYLYQADLVEGTGHFRCPVERGLDVIRGLRGHISGLGVPQFVIDAPGGGGKIPLLPEESFRRVKGGVCLKNSRGQQYFYFEGEEQEAQELIY